MLLDAVTKNFVNENGALRLTDETTYRQDAGLALNQLSMIWNNGEDVVPFIAEESFPAEATLAMLQAAGADFVDSKRELMLITDCNRIPDCVALLGNGTANGHAVLLDGHSYAWLALETYTSEAEIEIFMTHELAHAIHYRTTPEWYPATKEAYFQTGRAMFTEGLACYITMQTLGIPADEALWADTMTSEWTADWATTLEADRHEAWPRLKAAWLAPADPTLLTVNHDAPHAQNRAGYYYGLRLVQQMAERMSIPELLSLTPAEVASFVEHEG